MPAVQTEQMVGDLAAVTAVLEAAEHMGEPVKMLLLEGLPHATMEGCAHPYQKEFMALAGGVLEGCKTSQVAALRGIETELEAAEGALEAIKATEGDAIKILDEATAGVATAEAAAATAMQAVEAAEGEHAKTEKDGAAFLKERENLQQDRSRVAAIVEGPLKMLLEGGWDDEEMMTEANEAVQGMLEEMCSDKVILSAAPLALAVKPASRAQYDSMTIELVSKLLADHLASLDEQLRASEAEEVETKAEILGLWAIADCARDGSAVEAATLADAQAKERLAKKEVEASRKRAKAQDEEVAVHSSKRTRLVARLAEVDEAVAATGRLSTTPAAVEEPVV